jgi:murein DD-endopeptidase MepM/ murein hydrolase activator NlpD
MPLLNRLFHSLNHALANRLPEQRLFLKSDTDTRFVRLSPLTQATGIAVFCLAVGWMMFASAILLMGTIAAGSRSEQYALQAGVYEQRITTLSADRDTRAAEAASAQDRFTLALQQVSAMQELLLASEDRRRELETGIEVVQNTLRRVIKERDAARAEATMVTAALNGTQGAATEIGRAADTEVTLSFLTDALTATAKSRDEALETADRAESRVADIAKEKRALESRDAMIFAKLEDALNVSVEPLNKMFRDAGLNPDDLIAAVRRGYSGQGGPLSPISLSTSGQTASPEEIRANAILGGLDKMNLYRLAAFQVPFALPVKTAFRYTSSFGGREDPLGAGHRMHEGQDLAGAYGSPIYATADGVVTYAGWENGYGRLIKIQHAYGIETRYGHLSQIRVSVGERVSRGARIGDMGNSGRSTGTHLHYEVRLDGRAVNPMTFIRAANHVF